MVWKGDALERGGKSGVRGEVKRSRSNIVFRRGHALGVELGREVRGMLEGVVGRKGYQGERKWK